MTFRSEHLAEGVSLYCGDCLDVLPTLESNSVDSVVTDPPYHLTSIVKRFGAENAAPCKVGKTGAYARASAGFMGKQWDGGDIAFRPELWREVLRVLKPGGHLLAFSGTRTYHRMTCAIEDAGFEVRDQIGWAFGQGFPKSHNVGDGWGTALKPAWEPICVGRKPLEGTVAQNVLKWGTGALNIDGCRIETSDGLNGGAYREGEASADRTYADKGGTNFAMKPGMRRGRSPLNGDERTGAALGMFQEGKTVGKKFEQPPGRWPANVIHDGSDEVVGAFPDNLTSGTGAVKKATGAGTQANAYGKESRPVGTPNIEYGDTGSAARFFYTAKADSDDRLGSKHPTVKPLDLMQYLVRLVTPPKGLVLDPFAGTGTTGEAAIREGMRAILIEREAEYQEDIRRRMKLAMSGPDERAREAIKAKLKDKPVDHGPLFGGSLDTPPAARGDRFTDTSPTKTSDWPDRTQVVNET